jgi:hypothetical protein
MKLRRRKDFTRLTACNRVRHETRSIGGNPAILANANAGGLGVNDPASDDGRQAVEGNRLVILLVDIFPIERLRGDRPGKRFSRSAADGLAPLSSCSSDPSTAERLACRAMKSARSARPPDARVRRTPAAATEGPSVMGLSEVTDLRAARLGYRFRNPSFSPASSTSGGWRVDWFRNPSFPAASSFPKKKTETGPVPAKPFRTCPRQAILSPRSHSQQVLRVFRESLIDSSRSCQVAPHRGSGLSSESQP